MKKSLRNPIQKKKKKLNILIKNKLKINDEKNDIKNEKKENNLSQEKENKNENNNIKNLSNNKFSGKNNHQK